MSTDEVADSVRRADQSSRERLSALWADERQRGFPSFVGTRAEIAVPVRQVLVDRLVATALSRARGTDVQVEILEGARLAVSVSHRVFGMPASARTVLTIEPSVDLRQRRVVLRYEDSLLWRTIRGVVAPLGFLPPGIFFAHGAVLVDLETLATRGAWADVLRLVTRLEVHGPADGLILVDADIEIPARHPNGPPSVAAPSVSGGSRIPSDEWLEGIAGARARAEIHVGEALVNDALGELRTMLGEPKPREAGSAAATTAWWMSWVRELSLRFDRGQLVVVTDVEVPGPLTKVAGDPGLGSSR
jgi:hypothetical protein